MGNIKKTSLIIFDLDGTLVDSSRDITNALNYSLKPYGFKNLSVKDTIKIVGEGITSLIEKIVFAGRTDPDSELQKIRGAALGRFVQYYTEHIADFTRPYPCVIETLEQLHNFKKAVISNKRESMSKKLLEQLGLMKFFDIVLGSDSTSEKKPSPEPIRAVLKHLKILPENTVIVGDSEFDIQAGKSAGITTIAVTYGYRSRAMLKEADYIIDDIREIEKLIKGE